MLFMLQLEDCTRAVGHARASQRHVPQPPAHCCLHSLHRSYWENVG